MVLATPHWRAERKPAIVVGCYAVLHCGGNVKEYSLQFEEEGGQAWFHENDMELVKDNALEEWRDWDNARLMRE